MTDPRTAPLGRAGRLGFVEGTRRLRRTRGVDRRSGSVPAECADPPGSGRNPSGVTEWRKELR